MKTILIVCSWLELNSSIGSFFIEQAEVTKDDFNIVLSTIQKKDTSFWGLFDFFRTKKIQIEYTPDSNIPVYRVEYPRCKILPQKINSFFYLHYLKKFKKALDLNLVKVDLIHAQSIFNAGLHANALNNLYKIPFIFTEHNQLSLSHLTKQDSENFGQLLYKPYPKLVVSNDKIRQFAANYIFKDFINIGNLVNEDFFNFSEKQTNDNEFVLTTVGSYAPIKDQKTMLKALSLLDQNLADKNITFYWLGYSSWGKNHTEVVNDFVKSFNFKNINIKLIPTISRQELSKILKNTDLFLFSSISEGMPVSVLEALACGVPVCSTQCGGVDELINPDNGQLIQIKDHVGMYHYIKKFINRELNYNRKNISADVLRKFGKDSFRSKIKKVYLDTINEFGKS